MTTDFSFSQFATMQHVQNYKPIFEQYSDIQEQNKCLQEVAFKGKPNKKFLYALLNDSQNIEKHEFMQKGLEYYLNNNEINAQKRFFYGRQGQEIECDRLSNNHLAHPFMHKMVMQKLNYLIGKAYSITSDNEQYTDLLNAFFDDSIRLQIKNVAKDSLLYGIAWVQCYVENNTFKIKRIPSTQITPIWKDLEHSELIGLMRCYQISEYDNDGKETIIKRVEYYNEQGSWLYRLDNDGLIEENEEPSPIIQYQTSDGVQVDEVQKIPFLWLKYNDEEASLLQFIKPLLDDYDRATSLLSNLLADSPNSLKVVKGYSAQNVEEFVHNLATFNVAFVDSDGELDIKATPLDINAQIAHLERLRKDLYEAGSCVDTQSNDLGNASGEALKFRYADLDIDVKELGIHIKHFMQSLYKFYADWNKQDYQDFEVVFNQDVVINESETVNNLKASVGLISNETIVANHPYVNDVAAELELIEKEKEATFDLINQNDQFPQNQ